MYTLGAGRILIKSNIIVCLLNLIAWKASWAHRTGENEKKEKKIVIKKIGPNVERLWSIGLLEILVKEIITQTRLYNIQQYFTAVKMFIFR